MSTKITTEAAREIGSKGSEKVMDEVAIFVAWSEGHCWPVEWRGNSFDAHRTRQTFAAWRDRAALGAMFDQADSKPMTDDQIDEMAKRSLDLDIAGRTMLRHVIRKIARAVEPHHKIGPAKTTCCTSSSTPCRNRRSREPTASH